MRANPFVKERLYCPGPTPVPSEIGIAALQTDIYHRTDSFRQIVLECRRLLQPFFACQEAPLILTSSGTGALESALVNLTNPGDSILVINGGKFGERWEKLGQAYQCAVESYKIPWGTSPDLAEITARLKKLPQCRAVFFQANETSTGVAYQVEKIAEAIRSVSSALIVVDAVSGMIAHRMDMNAWGIDCVVSGSQKGFGIPPGLSFIALSDRAWKSLSTRPRFYFDLQKERKGQDTGETAWTPATTLIMTLLPALQKLSAIGPSACEAHHASFGKACRDAAAALGLQLFAKGDYSNALTSISLPNDMDGSRLVKLCRTEYGAIIAGGQDHLKGKIVRLAHLGMVDKLDFIAGVAALEMGLKTLGHKHALGAGVGAAMTSLMHTDAI